MRIGRPRRLPKHLRLGGLGGPIDDLPPFLRDPLLPVVKEIEERVRREAGIGAEAAVKPMVTGALVLAGLGLVFGFAAYLRTRRSSR